MAINKIQVFEICDQMFSEGEQPTLIKIRAALGSGSFSTISGYLAEWKTSSRAGDVVAVGDVPEEVSEIFTASLASMWSKAVSLAQSEASDVADQARGELKNAVVQLRETLELADAVQADNSSLVDKLMCLEADLMDCRRTVDSLNLQLAEAAATEKEFRRMHAEVVQAFKSQSKAKQTIFHAANDKLKKRIVSKSKNNAVDTTGDLLR